MDHLDKAIQNGFGQREWLENDSALDRIRGEPRFGALLAKALKIFAVTVCLNAREFPDRARRSIHQ